MSLFILNMAHECVRKIIYEFSTDWSLNEVPVTVASLNQFCCTLCPLHWALVFAHDVCYVTAAPPVPVFHRPGLYGIPFIGSGGHDHL
jgi:hypothetical protein